MVYSTNTILAHSGNMIYFRENSNTMTSEPFGIYMVLYIVRVATKSIGKHVEK